jgi:hypothetical protein
MPRESGASSNPCGPLMEAVPQTEASGYWIVRFHPKSALADLGTY